MAWGLKSHFFTGDYLKKLEISNRIGINSRMMTKIFRFLFVFLLGGAPLAGRAVSFDWSGWTRIEGYYQNSSSHNYYGGFHLTAAPEIHITDGLNISLRADLSNEPQGEAYRQDLGEGISPQGGNLFVYGIDSKKKPLGRDPYFLAYISQYYIHWQSDFLKIRLGRAPYHFGMGLDYSAEKNPFHHWMSVYDQAVIYLEYGPFYLQPAFLYEGKAPLGLLSAGQTKENWGLEALFRYDFDQEASFVSGFGRYEQKTWELKASGSYLFEGDNNISGLLAGEMEIPADFSLRAGLETGAALGDMSFHPNHDPALLLWNRFMEAPAKSQGSYPAGHVPTSAEEGTPQPKQAEIYYQPHHITAGGRLSKGAYVSLYARFSFWRESLKIKPSALLARDFSRKKFDYELDLEGIYKIEENLFFKLKGGILFHKKDLHLAVLAQTAISF